MVDEKNKELKRRDTENGFAYLKRVSAYLSGISDMSNDILDGYQMFHLQRIAQVNNRETLR